MRRIESHLTGARGQVLFTRCWLPEAPSRVLLVVHGFAEHSGRYDHVGAWFAQRGCAVHAYDQQGHGRSAGARGHVRRFGDLLDDLELVHGSARRSHPGLPIFALGHSMGGLVVAALLCERRPALAGAVVSGAPLALRGSAGRFLAPRLLRWLLPRLPIDSRVPPDALSRDPEVGRRYLEDPLVFSRMTVSLAAELFGAVERVGAGGAQVSVPLLMLHGEADPLCPVAASRSFHARVKSAGSAFRSYPELRHEIFNEPERERVFEDVLAWLDSLGDPK